MSGPPDPTWPLRTAGTGPWWQVSQDTLVLEIREEIARRRNVYPGLVAKGQLTRDGADREIALFAAIRDELEADAPIASSFTWHDKIHGLRREINLRRNSYPRRIEKGQLTHEDATRHIDVLEVIHWLYWMEGFTSDDPRIAAAPPRRDAHPDGELGDHAHADDWIAHWAALRGFFQDREGWIDAQQQRASAA